MNIETSSEIEISLIADRDLIFEKVVSSFKELAIESHIFGSMARGDSDAYSDIDIWFTFDDRDIEKVLNSRFEYYAKAGEILNICEPPQNAPLNGVHSSVMYKTDSGYVVVDYYLCPLASSHLTKESKKIFGIDLPIRNMEFNTKKVRVDQSYRIDFMIILITCAVKKILRKEELPLKQLSQEYEFLKDRYDIQIEPIANREQTFDSLVELVGNVAKVSNEKQRKTLSVITNFINKIQNDNN